MELNNRTQIKLQDLDEVIKKINNHSSNLSIDDIDMARHHLMVLNELIQQGLLHIEGIEILEKIENIK